MVRVAIEPSSTRMKLPSPPSRAMKRSNRSPPENVIGFMPSSSSMRDAPRRDGGASPQLLYSASAGPLQRSRTTKGTSRRCVRQRRRDGATVAPISSGSFQALDQEQLGELAHVPV